MLLVVTALRRLMLLQLTPERAHERAAALLSQVALQLRRGRKVGATVGAYLREAVRVLQVLYELDEGWQVLRWLLV